MRITFESIKLNFNITLNYKHAFSLYFQLGIRDSNHRFHGYYYTYMPIELGLV